MIFNRPIYSQARYKENGEPYIEVLWPGVERDDFDVEVVDDVLTVVNGDYTEKFRLASSLNLKKATATYEGGILTITFKRKKGQKIAVM